MWEYLVGAAGSEFSTGHPAVFHFVNAHGSTLPRTNRATVLDRSAGSGTTTRQRRRWAPVHWAGGEPNTAEIAERIAQEMTSAGMVRANTEVSGPGERRYAGP